MPVAGSRKLLVVSSTSEPWAQRGAALYSPQTWEFKESDRIEILFEAALRRYGVSVRPGSELEAAMFEIMDAENRRLGRSPIPRGPGAREALARGLGVLHFAELAVSAQAEDANALAFMVPHLRLLNDGMAAQNVRRIGDQAANKIFEGLIGLACWKLDRSVELDDPVHSLGNNPDVIFDLDGAKWAIACKVPNGDSMITAFENIESACDQIERCSAQSGVVVLNARNWLDHNRLWPPNHGPGHGELSDHDLEWAWATTDAPIALLRGEGERRLQALRHERGEELTQLFASTHKTIPVVLVFLQSTTMVSFPTGPVYTRVGLFHPWTFGYVRPEHERVLERLNEKLFQLPVIPGSELPARGSTDAPPSCR